MDFLYRERGAGKRAVKPSKDSEHLEALLGEESDDSDFEVENHADADSGGSGDESDLTEGSSDTEDGCQAENENESEASGEEDELMSLRRKLSTFEVLDAAKRHIHQTSSNQVKYPEKVCGTCLGTRSDDSDEIVECDSCGISVHEACYGIQESGSVASNISDASTEPWFCEPCRANIKHPTCQVCPTKGGIFKETDMGNWIHLVCALYTPHISFFDPQRITRATLFELNYQNWGRRSCTLCSEAKLARTGICIECDAGMCRSFFHVTCAQEHGLLSEPKEDDHESYFGHCRMHSDKETIHRRKRNYLAYLLRSKERSNRIQNDINNINENEATESAMKRILRKLGRQQKRWLSCVSQPAWIPTQKMPRSLLTSSSAVNHLQRKIDLQGWNASAMEEAEVNREILADINKRWGLTPAWNVEFVAYYYDRDSRIESMQEGLASTVLSNNELSDTQAVIREQYSKLVQEGEELSIENANLLSQITQYYTLLNRLDPLKRTLPDPNTRQKSTKSNIGVRKAGSKKSAINKVVKPSSTITSVCSPSLGIPSCRLCAKNCDQHLLALCDVCRFYYHLGCMSPPLERMPKKTKQYGWQCSECDKDPVESFNVYQDVVDVEAPRASRKRRSKTQLDSPDFENGCTSPVFQSLLAFPSPPLRSATPKATEKRETGNLEQAVMTKKPTVCLPRIKRRKLSDREPMDGDQEGTNRSEQEGTNSNQVPTNNRSVGKESRRRSERPRRSETSDLETSVKVREPKDSVFADAAVPTANGRISPSTPAPVPKGRPTQKEISPAIQDKIQFKDWLGKKMAPSIHDTSLPTDNDQMEENALNGSTSTDICDEVTPDVIGEKALANDHLPPAERLSTSGLEADNNKKERRRLKKEEKEKRREEKRKIKALMSVNIIPDADIEESDDSCVVRIAPKPIKIKIKPLIPPPPAPSPSFPYMHPKKKMVQMDSLQQINSQVRHSVPVQPVQPELRIKSPGLPIPPPSAIPGSPHGHGIHQSGRSNVQSEPTDSFTYKQHGLVAESLEVAPPVDSPLGVVNGFGREKRNRTPGSVLKKGQDMRTKCDVCNEEGTNSNLVRCDDCYKCYHFACLNPPVKKTPKIVGWSWNCSDCAPSDEDKSWHL